MTCKGICIRYKTGKNPDGSIYGNGIGRCSVCEIFIKHDTDFCPCCGFRLRKTPRGKKYKAKLRTRQK